MINTTPQPSLISPASASYLIVGLGNPGREYRTSRHNAGFMLIDQLAERLNQDSMRFELKALVTKTTFQSQRIILAKPQTFMNLSGQSISSLVRYYKIPLPNLLVAYDDVDLPFGMLRIRPMGGAAGQKGMLSIIEKLGTQEFPRLRIGIGRPPGHMDAAAYVLQNFSKDEIQNLPQLLERAVDAILCFVTQGLTTAMNQYNYLGE